MISIFTTFTDPKKRMDPWEEALECYNDFADEVIVTGKDWEPEFTWKDIGKNFQNGFDLSNGDWVIRMDIDYFFHEKSKEKLRNALKNSIDYPAIAIPQYQFFTTERFQLKTRLCIILNKKKFPEIKLNGGGDYCLATLNGTLITPNSVPNYNIPIYQYDAMFRTKEIISSDRARFARAWHREFGNYGDRGGSSSQEAFDAWNKQIFKKYTEHVHKFNLENHPKYIKHKLANLNYKQFGYDMFGIKDNYKFNFIKFIKGKIELYLGTFIRNLSRIKNSYS